MDAAAGEALSMKGIGIRNLDVAEDVTVMVEIVLGGASVRIGVH
jgi:hypothetical protein